MTSTVTTARQLWESGHPDFCALLCVWEAEKRCPFPLADLLLEHDLVAQSEAAKWAATNEERPDYVTANQCGLFPHLLSGGSCAWYRDYKAGAYCDSVPHNASGCVNAGTGDYYASCMEAFVAYLDCWRIAGD